MTTCSDWRPVEDRLAWFLNNRPAGVGMCAQHSWHALGGDRGCPPAWGTPNANAIVDKLRAAGKLYTHKLDAPPRGALVVWRYGANGHAALSLGDGRIATTDPAGKPGGTGKEPITYPKVWGAANGGRPTGWTDYYNGVTFAVGTEDDMALTDEDIDKIARRVWKYLDEYTERNMQYMIRKTYERTDE